MKRKGNTRIRILLLTGVLLAMAAAWLLYVSDYYHADGQGLDSAAWPAGCTISQEEDCIVFAPEQPRAALVFYPGGKVEETAYASLMDACAEKGILCILVRMPARLAILDIDAADWFRGLYPEIEHWYIGGHSLGGSSAAMYLARGSEGWDGLILLGSYSSKDLSQKPLEVLSIYGSQDGVLNRGNYESCRSNLPSGNAEYVIEGGNHAQFGTYGEQKGDGKATISNEEQIELTARYIADFVFDGVLAAAG